MISIFKHYNQWRKRRIVINETAWETYTDMKGWILPPSISVAALSLRKRLRQQGVELSHKEACKRMLRLEKGCR